MISRAMYAALLRQQFVLQRTELIAIGISAGAVAPLSLLSIKSMASDMTASNLLDVAMPLTVFSVILALVTGMVFAVRPYVTDALTRHTYAQALPITRSQYTLIRALTGLTLALIPVVAYGIGAVLSVASVAIPNELYAYPIGVTLRCALAILVCYSFAFALQYGLGARAGRMLLIIILLLGALEVASQLLFMGALTADLWRALFAEASPFAVFNSSWMLFDV